MANKKSYDKSFKEEAVKLAEETNVNSAARSLGIHKNTLRKWVKNTRERPDNPFIGSGRKYIPAQDAEKLNKGLRLLSENVRLYYKRALIGDVGFYERIQNYKKSIEEKYELENNSKNLEVLAKEAWGIIGIKNNRGTVYPNA